MKLDPHSPHLDVALHSVGDDLKRHWRRTSNPFPDPSAWAEIDDPHARLDTALDELYRWYADKEEMLGKVLKDLHTVEALAAVMEELWSPYMRQLVDTLAVGWPGSSTDADELSAALRLAVDFDTWRLLTGSGLDDGAAAGLAARMVTAGVIETAAAAPRSEGSMPESCPRCARCGSRAT